MSESQKDRPDDILAPSELLEPAGLADRDLVAEVASPAHGGEGTDEFVWDVFISFRHKDARKVARKLRLQLLNWRLPDHVQADRNGPLRIYVDTFQGHVTNDYWTENIAPALKASRYLVVILSPAVFEQTEGGGENWVQREVRTFLETRQRANIIPVYAPTQKEKILPAVLTEQFPRIQTFDLGSKDSFMPQLPVWESAARLELVRIVAAVRGVRQDDYPRLYNEEWRRRVRSYAVAGVAGLVVTCTVMFAGITAFINGIDAVRTSAKSALRLAAEAATQRPDEAALQAARALRIVDSSLLYRFYLNSERAQARDILGSLRLPSSIIAWPGGRPASVALSEDKTEIAVWTENSRFVVYDAHTLAEKRHTAIAGLSGPCDIGRSPEAWLLACSSSAPQVRVITKSGDVRSVPAGIGGDRAVLLSNGTFLHQTSATGRLSLINPVSGEARPFADVSVGPLEDAVIVPSAKRLLVHVRLNAGLGYEQRLFDLDGVQVGAPTLTSLIDPHPVVLNEAGIYLRSEGSQIFKHDLVTGRQLDVIDGYGTLTSIHATANGKLALVERNAPGGYVEVWNLMTAKQIAPALHPIVTSAAPVFSASGTSVAVNTQTGTLLLNTAVADKPQWLPTDAPVNEVVFTDDGGALAVADLSGKVGIFGAEDGGAIVRGIRHRDGGVRLKLLPDGRILSAGWDGSIRATPAAAKTQYSPVAPQGSDGKPVSALAVAPEGDDFIYAAGNELALCTAGSSVCRWRLSLKEAAASLSFVGGGKHVLIGFGNGGASLRDTNTGREEFAHASATVVASDKRRLLAILERGAPIRVRTTRHSGRQTCEGSEPLGFPIVAKATKDGYQVVVASGEASERTTLSSYDTLNCHRQWTIETGIGGANVLSISDETGFVAIGGAAGGELYRLGDGARWDKSLEDRNAFFDLVFSSAEPLLLSLGASRKVSAYELPTGRRRFIFEAGPIPWRARFTPDGHHFAVAYITANERQQYLAQAYDAHSGLPIGPPLLHPSDVLEIAITASGRHVVTGSSDGLVRSWSIGPDDRDLNTIIGDITARTGETIEYETGAIRSARDPTGGF